MRIIDDVRRDHPEVEFEVIDITERPEVAVRYRVMMTPAIAINGELAFAGIPSEPALRAQLLATCQPG